MTGRGVIRFGQVQAFPKVLVVIRSKLHHIFEMRWSIKVSWLLQPVIFFLGCILKLTRRFETYCCMGPTPRDSDLIVWGMARASGVWKIPQMLLMCGQAWESLFYLFSPSLMAAPDCFRCTGFVYSAQWQGLMDSPTSYALLPGRVRGTGDWKLKGLDSWPGFPCLAVGPWVIMRLNVYYVQTLFQVLCMYLFICPISLMR